MTSTGERGSLQPESVSFQSQGERCDADLYPPTAGDPPWPTVVLAHGFGASRTWGLAPFAERFAAAGLAAFVFDYRHFGTSKGRPRRLVDPDRQLADWAAALEHVRSMPVVDAARVALWGTSFGGGHALATARRESGVRAVVAQVPFVDGRATVAHAVGEATLVDRARTLGLAVADRLLAGVGRGPVELPLVTGPDGGGLLSAPRALSAVEALVPEEESLVNRTPARVVLDLPRYRPGRGAAEIDVPVHVVVADEDRVLPRGPTERLLDRLADPSVHRIDAGHFGAHFEPHFDPVVDQQVAFLRASLVDTR